MNELYSQTQDKNSFEKIALIYQDKFKASIYIWKKENEITKFQQQD